MEADQTIKTTGDVPIIGSVWRHLGGTIYIVTGFCLDAEVDERMVLYQSIESANSYDDQFVIPLWFWQCFIMVGNEKVRMFTKSGVEPPTSASDAAKRGPRYILNPANAGELASTPRVSSIWSHYKGHNYIVTGYCYNDLKKQFMIMYEAVEPTALIQNHFVRTMPNWFSTVTHEGHTVPRFTKLK
jgi:hypothetical protein